MLLNAIKLYIIDEYFVYNPGSSCNFLLPQEILLIKATALLFEDIYIFFSKVQCFMKACH